MKKLWVRKQNFLNNSLKKLEDKNFCMKVWLKNFKQKNLGENIYEKL